MRELREFRVAHDRYAERGLVVAGINRESVEKNTEWARRLSLPYPLLSDAEQQAGHALRVIRRLGLGAWTVDLYRRSTFLVDRDGLIAAVWGNVKVRGHAAQVLAAAEALDHNR